MVDPITPLQAGTRRLQAARFHGRERRRSLAGVPELSRTHLYAIPTATIPAAAFPAASIARPITFRTAIRFGAGAHAGLVFEIGNATTSIAVWVDGQELTLRAGDTGDDLVTAAFDNGAAFAEGLELDIVAAVIPGDGRARLWANGAEVARGTAVNDELPNGWAASSDGAFAAAASGSLAADVTETGAPSNFAAIAPLSAFVGQTPRHFV